MKDNLLLFSTLLGVFFSNAVMAKPYSSVLPTQFPIKKVIITVSNQSNNKNTVGYHISLNGNGNSFLVKTMKNNR